MEGKKKEGVLRVLLARFCYLSSETGELFTVVFTFSDKLAYHGSHSEQ